MKYKPLRSPPPLTNLLPSKQDSDENDQEINDAAAGRSTTGKRGALSGVDVQVEHEPSSFQWAAAPSEPSSSGVIVGGIDAGRMAIPQQQQQQPAMVPIVQRVRRRSVFAPGGNRLVYKRAFSARQGIS